MRLCILYASSISLQPCADACLVSSMPIIFLNTHLSASTRRPRAFAKNGFLSYSINTEQANQQKFAQTSWQRPAQDRQKKRSCFRHQTKTAPFMSIFCPHLNLTAKLPLPKHARSGRSLTDRARAANGGSLA